MIITLEKKQEEQLRRSQKMDALGKLTGGIAHDYNNMLGVILGYSRLLQEELADNPKLHKFVNEIHRASEEQGSRVHAHALLSNSRGAGVQYLLRKTVRLTSTLGCADE